MLGAHRKSIPIINASGKHFAEMPLQLGQTKHALLLYIKLFDEQLFNLCELLELDRFRCD